MSTTRATKSTRSSPLLSEHEYVFGQLLGMSTAEITELAKKQAIY
jgi:hypothetical protein